MSKIFDTLNHITSIRFIRGEKYVEDKMLLEYSDFLKENISYQRWNACYDFFQNMTISFLENMMFILGVVFISKGNISISSFISYYFILSFFLDSIHHFLFLGHEFLDSKEAISRIEELYEVGEEKIANTLFHPIEKIQLQDLSFSYRRGNEVFRHWNATFQKGDRILLYGDSGCGKSTLSRILAGYEDRYQGIIFVNGEVILPENITSLRSHVCYICQGSGLLNMSLRENILMGRQVDENRLKEVLGICHVFEISQNHVLGLDMMIEEGGINLSGGECQRVVLARSLLQESDVYILDESLCNVDILKERKILEGIFSFLKDKIVIVVSHRFYNADLYNRKIKFTEGEVS